MALFHPNSKFNGNAKEALNFFKSVLGGEFAKIIHFKEISSPEYPEAENQANKIIHIALPIGKNISLFSSGKPVSLPAIRRLTAGIPPGSSQGFAKLQIHAR